MRLSKTFSTLHGYSEPAWLSHRGAGNLAVNDELSIRNALGGGLLECRISTSPRKMTAIFIALRCLGNEDIQFPDVSIHEKPRGGLNGVALVCHGWVFCIGGTSEPIIG